MVSSRRLTNRVRHRVSRDVQVNISVNSCISKVDGVRMIRSSVT